ncbi:DUF4145 domain-containing protein [Sphingomonas sp. RHCKR47]|uniref:DUF4145 domain-containing protein n=1 Tax=Sphingomonas citricola TaxID=2862498 RepID=UPI001C66CC89|nr:DUF4145 domain-containing protein [Sphingomonas citricola]MBW6523418.1 DUF4145 domain-containing protein [Sphingomonas citricola]
MSIITADCPHCGAQNMTFSVFGVFAAADFGGVSTASISAACKKCSLPIVIRVFSKSAGSSEHFTSNLRNRLQSGWELEGEDTTRIAQWPERLKPQIPADLPSEVEKAFSQAEVNRSTPDCEEAAAMMYRRSLELGVKSAYPQLTGSLAARIKTLVRDHHLPATIGDWLDQVRLIGNDGAHEVEGVTRDELIAARGFVDAALRYIFTLPAEVARRRGLPTEVA